MNPPLPVVWSEGLFMTPQHMQQQDRYFGHLLQSRLSHLDEDCWGIVFVSFDDHALRQGQVAVADFGGVMPDGLPLELSTTTLPPARPIDEHFPPTLASLDLFLAVPQSRDGVSNVSGERNPRVRWYRSIQTTHDLIAEAEPREVEYAQPNAVLLFGDEPREGYDSIKIAELVRSEGGVYALSDTYVPPCLTIASSTFLLAGLRRLLSAMTTRRAALAALQQERGDSLEYNASDVTRFLFLNSINTHLPLIDHFVDSGDLSPRALYITLIQLVGQLSMFSKDFDPSSIPKYVFADLRSTFEPLFAMINYLLNAPVQQHYVALPLDPREDGMHLGQLDEESYFRSKKFILSVRSGLSAEEVREKLPRLSKLASWQDVNSILSAATPGAPVEVTYRPPPQIPIKAGTTYFIIDTDNQYWRNILAERAIAVYLPAPFVSSETKLELLCVLESGQRVSGQAKR